MKKRLVTLTRSKTLNQSAKLILFLFFFPGVLAVEAQENYNTLGTDSMVLEEQEAVATALANNFDIALVKNDSAVYALNEEFSDAVFMPRLSGTGVWVNNINNQRQQLADGSERKRNSLRSGQLQAAVNLNWTIFDGFKMFITREKSLEMAELGQLVVKQEIQNSISEVIKTYYNIVREKQSLAAIEEQMGLNEERLTLAEKNCRWALVPNRIYCRHV